MSSKPSKKASSTIIIRSQVSHRLDIDYRDTKTGLTSVLILPGKAVTVSADILQNSQFNNWVRKGVVMYSKEGK